MCCKNCLYNFVYVFVNVFYKYYYALMSQMESIYHKWHTFMNSKWMESKNSGFNYKHQIFLCYSGICLCFWIYIGTRNLKLYVHLFGKFQKSSLQ